MGFRLAGFRTTRTSSTLDVGIQPNSVRRSISLGLNFVGLFRELDRSGTSPCVILMLFGSDGHGISEINQGLT